ncbi:MAG: hypothetical protein ACE5JX_10105, partial [Acidobacteriota bacterium]
ILRTDPVDFQKIRVRGRLSPLASLRFDGSFSLFDHDDDLESIDFSSRDRDLMFQFTYTPHNRITVSGSYERSSYHSNLLFLIPQTFQTDRSIYRERGDYADLFLSLGLIRNARLDLGYSVWGTVGDFPLTSHRPLARLEVPVGERVTAYAQWNYYDYNEKVKLFPQDYQTHLVSVGLRLSLNKLSAPTP